MARILRRASSLARQQLLLLHLITTNELEQRSAASPVTAQFRQVQPWEPPSAGSSSRSTLSRGPRRQAPVTMKRASQDTVSLRDSGELS
jgi:hypothetical protein